MKVWENHQVDHINRMPARAHFLTFPTRDKALLGSNGYTHAFKNLNGVWKFMFLDAPEYSPEGFESTEFDEKRVNFVQERIQILQKLFKKHGLSGSEELILLQNQLALILRYCTKTLHLEE